MKIYERIVMDWDGVIVEEKSFEYEGPLSLAGGGGGKGKTPSPPPPAPKPATAKDVTAAATDAVNEQEAKRKKMMGQQGTIMTSPLGASTPVQVAGKTLLGQ